MQNKGIAITGMGIMSAIGNSVLENREALVSGRSGISHLENFESVHKGVLPVGEIKLTNVQLSNQLNLPKHNAFTRGTMLATLAIKDALASAKLDSCQTEDIGFINGTSVGGMDYTEQFFPQFKDAQRYVETIDAGVTTQQIAEYFEINGYVSTISTACSSGANAILLGARLIASGRLKRVIVGGVDCLSKFTLNGFNSLLLCSQEPNTPFDEHRNGLNLGEGSAYLILEAEDLLKNKTVLARVSGFGNANDAFHQTASSPNGEGAFLAMQKALKNANLSAEQIDYVNAHGTATPNNDASESVALQRIFDGNVPKFSSTKGFTGHTLATAGAMEAVFSVFMLQHQELYANLNFETPIKDSGLVPVMVYQKANLHHILSNSFGFGGNCTSLIFSKA